MRVYKDRLGQELRVVAVSFDGSGQACGKASMAVYKDSVPTG